MMHLVPVKEMHIEVCEYKICGGCLCFKLFFSTLFILCTSLTCFFLLSLSETEEEVENFDVSSLPEEVLQNIEADSYWCMSKLLDGIQVN